LQYKLYFSFLIFFKTIFYILFYLLQFAPLKNNLIKWRWKSALFIALFQHGGTEQAQQDFQKKIKKKTVKLVNRLKMNFKGN